MKLKAAVAHALAGDADEARQLASRLGTEPIELGGDRLLPPMQIVSSIVNASSQPRRRASTVFSPPVRPAAASAPHLEPLWSRTYAEGLGSELPLRLAEWEQERFENLRPIAAAVRPVVVDETARLLDEEHDALMAKLDWEEAFDAD